MTVIAGLTRNGVGRHCSERKQRCHAGLDPASIAACTPPWIEQVTFQSLDATPIQAHVFQPAQQPPRGTVVALHGCGVCTPPQARERAN